MKFSINLASYYSDVDYNSLPHSELLLRIGSQLGAVESVEDWSKKYHGIVVAKVVYCQKHPNADKLSLCVIDDGGVTEGVDRDENGNVQVVCGAPNVAQDMYVAWIPPRSIVPSTYNKDKFILESRELRGKMSNGMIASPKELDISDSHEGILEITRSGAGKEPVIGEPIVDYYGLDDFVVDCENKMFTHRPDCFGNLGIAREVAGIFDKPFKSPYWYTKSADFELIEAPRLNIENNLQDKVPRFMCVALNNIEIKSSPVWMQAYLTRIGIKSINNVVDITNYVMHLTGQPIHAFDFDKISDRSNSAGIRPRMAEEGEVLKLLGDKTIKLSKDDIVIATDRQVVALGGIMGGLETEVDENTKSILIECANFDMYTIRKSSMRHGLFTDAVTRFNKGQSPLQNDRVLWYAMKLLSELANGKQSSNVYDIASFDTKDDQLNKVVVKTDFINNRLGSNLSDAGIKSILENVEFEVDVYEGIIEVTVPFWRMDISIPEDIVEEVGRLYGYYNLPVELIKRKAKPAPRSEIREFKMSLKNMLSGAGANEVLTYSFVHRRVIESTGVDPDKWAYHLRNAISPSLQYYRTSLIPSLLDKVHANIKAQAGNEDNEFAIYELGKVHIKGHNEEGEENLPKQMRRLALVVGADKKTSNKYSGSAYYLAKRYLDLITDNQAKYEVLDTFEYPMTSPYRKGRSARVSVNGQILGVIGEFKQKTVNSFKLPEFCAGFEIDTDILQSSINNRKYVPLSSFPGLKQDITYEVSDELAWSDLYNFLDAEFKVASAEEGYKHYLYGLDIYKPEKSDFKRVSFRLEVSHKNKTLKTEEVNSLIDKISKVVDEKFQAKRI